MSGNSHSGDNTTGKVAPNLSLSLADVPNNSFYSRSPTHQFTFIFITFKFIRIVTSNVITLDCFGQPRESLCFGKPFMMHLYKYYRSSGTISDEAKRKSHLALSKRPDGLWNMFPWSGFGHLGPCRQGLLKRPIIIVSGNCLWCI